MLVPHAHATQSLCLTCASLVLIFSKPCAYIQHLACGHVNFVEGREGVGCILKFCIVCRLWYPVLFFSVLIGKQQQQRRGEKERPVRYKELTKWRQDMDTHTNRLVLQQNSKCNYMPIHVYTPQTLLKWCLLNQYASALFSYLPIILSNWLSSSAPPPLFFFFFFKFLCLSSVLVSFCHIFYSWWRPLCWNVKVFLCLCPIFFSRVCFPHSLLLVQIDFYYFCSFQFLVSEELKRIVAVLWRMSVIVWTLVKQQTVCLKSFFLFFCNMPSLYLVFQSSLTS